MLTTLAAQGCFEEFADYIPIPCDKLRITAILSPGPGLRASHPLYLIFHGEKSLPSEVWN